MKEFLSQKQVGFTERNILADPTALDELVAMGHMTTPVILVGDEVVVGFDVARLEKLLADRSEEKGP